MSVLYVVFRAFSYDLPYLELLCMQTMLQASVCFVPLPGASGAQELGFSMFFTSYFSSGEILYTAVLVWRFFTYYIIVDSRRAARRDRPDRLRPSRRARAENN